MFVYERTDRMQKDYHFEKFADFLNYSQNKKSENLYRNLII